MWGPPGAMGPAGAGGSGSSANITPDTHPSSPTAWDDEFEFGTTLDVTGARRSGANAWTAFNQTSGMTLAVAQGALQTAQPVVSSSTDVSIFYQTAPSGAWTVVAKMAILTANIVGLYAGVHTGKFLVMGFLGSNAAATAFNSSSSFSSTLASNGWPAGGNFSGSTTQPSWVYLMMSWDGTQVTAAISPTGVPGSFQTVATSTFLGAAPAEVGFCSDAFGGPSNITMDWFRRTA